MSNKQKTLLLKGGTVVDGSGEKPYKADVLIRGEKIAGIFQAKSPEADESFDCTGKYIAPGFIDAHSHMDYYAASQKPAFFDSFTRQGITTFIGGNCGFSPCTAHLNSKHNELLANTLFEVPDGAGVLCDHIDGFYEKLNAGGIKHNFFSLVGHGSFRTSISGHEPRPLREGEESDLLCKLGDALSDGAIGVSLGLQYKPGVFVPDDEIEKVALLCKEHNKILTVHARAYSKLSGTYPLKPFGRPHNLKAIEDMINLAERTGVRLQFSHLIFVGRKTWGSVGEALRLIHDARKRGVDICFDIFPYPFGATLLNSIFPEWFMAKMPEAAKSKLDRFKLWLEMSVGFPLVGLGYPDIKITYAGCSEYKDFEGMTISEIAQELKQSDFYTMIDILEKSDSLARVINETYYGPGHVEELMRSPAVLFSTDAWPELSGIQNPAAYGSFPKFLQITKDSKNITLEECVHKMTGATASRFNLKGRGYLREDHCADVVVLDYKKIRDLTTASCQDASPEGVEMVLINGEKILGI